MVNLPSFSGWLSKQSLFFQVNFNGFMKISPILIVLYGYTICKNVLGMSQEQAFFLPTLAGMMVFGVFMAWDFGNRNSSTAYLPINMTVVWNASKAEEIISTITDYVPLKEDPVGRQYVYMVRFDMPLTDEKGIQFKNAIFINSHPIDKTFRRIPGQFVAFRGSVFEGMAARVVATYANEFEDLEGIKREDMKIALFKVFHVKWCLEDSKNDQIKLGLYSETGNGIDKDIVEEGSQLEIDRKATRLAMMLRESEGQLRSFSEAYQDAETRGKKIMNRLIDDMDRIKKERGLITRLMRDRWVRILLMVLLVAAAFYLARYYKVI